MFQNLIKLRNTHRVFAFSSALLPSFFHYSPDSPQPSPLPQTPLPPLASWPFRLFLLWRPSEQLSLFFCCFFATSRVAIFAACVSQSNNNNKWQEEQLFLEALFSLSSLQSVTWPGSQFGLLLLSNATAVAISNLIIQFFDTPCPFYPHSQILSPFVRKASSIFPDNGNPVARYAAGGSVCLPSFCILLMAFAKGKRFWKNM